MGHEQSRFVVYLRVSTPGQGRSGLGLGAQREAVQQFVAGRGGAIVVPEFVEVESGKRNDRPELVKALKRCRLTGSTLVVAKLDRLSRNAAFLLTLRDSGVDFVAMTVGVMAVVAQINCSPDQPNGADVPTLSAKAMRMATPPTSRPTDFHRARMRWSCRLSSITISPIFSAM
jgi:hypothetical protein